MSLIAVLDDSVTIAEMIRIGLKYSGFTVREFSVAALCIDTVTRSKPGSYDCIICDRQLCGSEDGLDVIRAIREAIPGMPAILMSGSTDRELAQIGEETGLPVIGKPFQFAHLTELIQQVTGTRQPAAFAG